MNTEIGRNESCPCGSGKKYKNCCLGREAAKPSANPAAEVNTDLRKAMEGHKFSSLEEIQAFTDRFFEERNSTPQEDFHGLSPDQMYRILHFPFASSELVTFPETLGITPTAPILTLFGLLVKGIPDQGLKPTAKGNLPQKFCRETARAYWGEKGYKRRTEFGDIYKEEDFMDLQVTRIVAELAGLIRKFKGKFILSRKCRALLAGPGMAGIFPRLMRAYAKKFNWGYWDLYPDTFFIQDSFLFTLYLLTSEESAWRPQSYYEDCYIRAFPRLLNEVGSKPLFNPEENLRNCYTLRTLLKFARFLGFAAVEPLTDDFLNSEYRVKKLPLLQETVQFHIQNY